MKNWGDGIQARGKYITAATARDRTRTQGQGVLCTPRPCRQTRIREDDPEARLGSSAPYIFDSSETEGGKREKKIKRKKENRSKVLRGLFAGACPCPRQQRAVRKTSSAGRV